MLIFMSVLYMFIRCIGLNIWVCYFIPMKSINTMLVVDFNVLHLTNFYKFVGVEL